MDASTNAPISGTWYYETRGHRNGPIGYEEARELVARGVLSFGSQVWAPGQNAWTPIERSGLADLLDGPPPLLGEKVNNTFVWLLAIAPVLGWLLQWFVAGMLHDPATLFPLVYEMRVAQSAMDLWWITVVLNVGLSWIDDLNLEVAGHKRRGMWLAWLIPAYLYARSRMLKQSYVHLIVWSACFAFVVFYGGLAPF